jgi:UDP-N-acetylmuramyl pentapeptide phosphotransferase/UDP-N-acetylglucosamine-1-phosphate transferase
MHFFEGQELTPFGFTCLAAAASLFAAAAVFLLAGPARRYGLVSRHRRDRFGRGQVPLTGGPALLAGLLPPLVVLGFPLAPGEAVASAGFFLVGLVDDLRELKPAAKFALQSVVAAGAALLLLPPAYLGLGALAFLFLVNACNYLDNMDGLLAGVAITQAVTLVLLDLSPSAGAPLLLWGLPVASRGASTSATPEATSSARCSASTRSAARSGRKECAPASSSPCSSSSRSRSPTSRR